MYTFFQSTRSRHHNLTFTSCIWNYPCKAIVRTLLGKEYFYNVLCSPLIKLLPPLLSGQQCNLYVLLDWTDNGHKHKTRHFWNADSLATAPHQTLLASKFPVLKGCSKVLRCCSHLGCTLEKSVKFENIYILRPHGDHL